MFNNNNKGDKMTNNENYKNPVIDIADYRSDRYEINLEIS